MQKQSKAAKKIIIKTGDTVRLKKGNTQTKYIVITVTNNSAVLKGKDTEIKEKLVPIDGIQLICPLDVGKRYMFTPRGGDKFSGIWEVTAIKNRKFAIYNSGLIYELNMFSDITLIQSENLV